MLLAVALAGLGQAPAWIAVPGGAVLLLWVADRGQHQWLADKFPGMPKDRIVGVSVAAHAMLGAVACAAAYAFGRFSSWLFAV